MTVSITTRAAKGSALTYAEMDANFSNLKAAVDALQSGSGTPSPTPTPSPSVTYPSGRYLTVAIFNGSFIDMDYVGLIAPDGTEHAATWMGDNDRAPNLASQDGNTYFAQTNAGAANAQGDLGAVFQAYQIVAKPANNGSLPTKFQVWIASASGGKDTLIVNVNEPDSSAWSPATRRIFNVAHT